MSSDDDWEFSALEEHKRTFPEIVIEVGKSYADAVLQQRSGVRDREPREAAKVVPSVTHEFVNVEAPTFLRVKPGRKQDNNMKRQSKIYPDYFQCTWEIGNRPTGILKLGDKDQKSASVSKNEVPLTFDMAPDKNPLVAMAEDFALSDACHDMMDQLKRNATRGRMPYTKTFSKQC